MLIYLSPLELFETLFQWRLPDSALLSQHVTPAWRPFPSLACFWRITLPYSLYMLLIWFPSYISGHTLTSPPKVVTHSLQHWRLTRALICPTYSHSYLFCKSKPTNQFHHFEPHHLVLPCKKINQIANHLFPPCSIWNLDATSNIPILAAIRPSLLSFFHLYLLASLCPSRAKRFPDSSLDAASKINSWRATSFANHPTPTPTWFFLVCYSSCFLLLLFLLVLI